MTASRIQSTKNALYVARAVLPIRIILFFALAIFAHAAWNASAINWSPIKFVGVLVSLVILPYGFLSMLRQRYEFHTTGIQYRPPMGKEQWIPYSAIRSYSCVNGIIRLDVSGWRKDLVITFQFGSLRRIREILNDQAGIAPVGPFGIRQQSKLSPQSRSRG